MFNTYNEGVILKTFVNVDFASDQDDRKSATAYMFYFVWYLYELEISIIANSCSLPQKRNILQPHRLRKKLYCIKVC